MQCHATAVPFASPVAQVYLVPFFSLALILKLYGITLDDMQNKTRKQTNLHNADDQRGTHKVSRSVKHRTVICRISKWCIKVVKNTGIQTNMDDEERNQKETSQRHHYFSTNCRCEEEGPFHIMGGLKNLTKRYGRSI